MTIINKVEKFISTYATLAEDYYFLPIALWVTATHTWPTFDTFPYLEITANVKRSGKTRLMELCAMLSAYGRTFSADSPSSMFRSLTSMDDENGIVNKPTMFLDEAEKLNDEKHPAREFLNKGYRAGQTIPKTINNQVIDMECFCPKCFVLIGDIYDTLRDRCIIVRMRRRTPIEAESENKFRFAIVRPEGDKLRAEISETIKAHQSDIEAAYLNLGSLSFLNDRDEEVWSPLFAVCKALCPDRLKDLVRAAMDMSTEKTAPKRKSIGDIWAKEEEKADNAEFSILLIRDMLVLCDNKKYVLSSTIVEQLHAIPTSPWRKFKGRGLNHMDIGFLLKDVKTKPVRVSKRKGDVQTARAYMRDDMEAAAHLMGFKQKGE